MDFDHDRFGDQVWHSNNRVDTLLRGHLSVEHFLEQLLEKGLSRPAELGRLTWRQKLAVVAALGLVDPQGTKALSRLNKLRNGLAHDLSVEPTDDDIAALIDANPLWKNSTEAVVAGQDRSAGDAPGGLSIGDVPLGTLQCWFLVVMMDLDYRAHTHEYETENQAGLVGAAAHQLMAERRGKRISWEEAQKRAGLPPRPWLGQTFGASDPSTRLEKSEEPQGS